MNVKHRWEQLFYGLHDLADEEDMPDDMLVRLEVLCEEGLAWLEQREKEIEEESEDNLALESRDYWRERGVA